MIVLAVLWIGSCGSSDLLLDENTQRYRAQIAIEDLDEETLTVDVIQSMCDSEAEDYGPASAAVTFSVDVDAAGITLQEYVLEYIPLESEDGTGTIVMPPTLDSPLRGGNLSIDIQAGETTSFNITCMSTDTKEEYRRKVGWVFYSEVPEGQAAIEELENEVAALQQEIADTAAAGGDTTALEEQLDLLQEELAALPFTFYSVPELMEARYKIRITFRFEDEFGEDREISREATVWLGPYDNC
jgi:hypothetical protein